MPSKKGLRNSVFDFYQIHKDKGKPYTVNHFSGPELYSKKYLYRLLKTFDDRGTSERKSSGVRRKLSKKDGKRLKKLVDNKTGCSQRKLAQKFNVSVATINREIKHWKCG